MGERILTVDDSKTFRMVLGVSLRKGGYEIIEAADGEEALEKLESETVDMVITDLTMPGMDGIELTRRIRGKDRYRDTPIILLTTEDNEGKKEEGHRAGATGWIVKPFDPEEFLAVVDDLLP